jgi:hypothetical protein
MVVETFFTQKLVKAGSLDSSIVIMTRLQTEQSRDRVWIPGRSKRLFLFSKAFRIDLGPTQLSIQRIPGILTSKAKRPKREVDRSVPLSAEVKRERR